VILIYGEHNACYKLPNERGQATEESEFNRILIKQARNLIKWL